MSRAFVKEQDDDAMPEDFGTSADSDQPNYITPAGLVQLRARYHAAVEAHRALQARSRDHSGQQSALRAAERELRWLSLRLDRAVEVDPAAQTSEEVHFGAEVETLDEDGKTHCFRIVGQDETDIAQGRVSWTSPLARALNGARLGDVVEWQRPAGALQLEITAIRYRRN